MALADSGRWQISFTLEDNNKKKATLSFFASSTLIFTGAVNLMNAVRDQLVILSNAKLVNSTITRTFKEDAPVPAPKESEVERKLVLPFTTNIPGHGTTIEVPSPVFTLEQDGTDVPILTAPALVALQDLIVDGGVGFENGVVTIANVQITERQPAYVRHRTRTPNRN